MMNKSQNPNPWARWKALLFMPLAALLVQAFARPEINRELEQISALKDTEIVQENTGWTEEKFLAELRKFLPESVSRELSYAETWQEIVKTYGFFQNGDYSKKEGMVIMMNRRGNIMINATYIIMENIPDLLKENLARKGMSVAPLIIDGKKVSKINRWTWIQRDVSSPTDDYQKLLNAVGEAYISKRDEMAQEYYQTGYHALNAEKKSVIDDVVPMLVNIEPKGPFRSTPPTDEELDKAAAERKKGDAEFEKITNQQITYNSQQVTIKALFELVKKDTNDHVIMLYRVITNRNTQERIYRIVISAEAIDPKEPKYYYLMDGKWVYSINSMDINSIQSINTYTPADAVEKFGSKAKNGAIAITSK